MISRVISRVFSLSLILRLYFNNRGLLQDILEGGNVRNALQELQQIIITPIKAYTPPTAAQREVEPGATPTDKAANPVEEKDASVEGFQSHNPPPGDGETSATPISDGDIPGQFTRVMGKGDVSEQSCFSTNTLNFYTQAQRF